MRNRIIHAGAASGNALFLILIAVALFAALSYAVTQSGRGGGSVDREQALIAASQVTQYAAGLRTTVTRMGITGTNVNQTGAPPTAGLDFGTDSAASDQIFDSAGGGAIEQTPPNGASTSANYTYLPAPNGANGWFIMDIGTNAGREVMVVLDALSQTVCTEINRGLGLSTTIQQEAVNVNLTTAAAGPAAATVQTTTFAAETGEPFACVDNDSAGTFDYTYYHALAEQ